MAFGRCQYKMDPRRATAAVSFYANFVGEKCQVAVPLRLCFNSTPVALRISRLCFLKAEEGASKEEISKFRDKCLAAIKTVKPLPQKEILNSETSDVKGQETGDAPATRDSDSDSTSSSSSASSGVPDENEEGKLETQVKKITRPHGSLCAKMLVRSGFRCPCHYKMQCPGKISSTVS